MNDEVNEFYIDDTYKDINMKHFLYGDKFDDYQLFILSSVLLYYNKRAVEGISEVNKNYKNSCCRKHLQEAISKSNDIYELLSNLKIFCKCSSVECIYANILYAYNFDDNSLLIRAGAIFSRILKLKEKTEWLDNWRINAFGNCMNLFMWNSFEPNDKNNQNGNSKIFTIKRNFVDINTSKKINYEKFVKYSVGVLREFIIKMNIYPGDNVPKKLTDIYNILNSKRFNEISYEEISDECYLHFPFYYLGSHGCDALLSENPKHTSTIKDISDYLERYPSAVFSGIMNTSTYGSYGKHWVSVNFYNKNMNNNIFKEAALFCSQGGGWNSFDISSEINKELRKYSFPTTYNKANLQIDTYSCGNFSIISSFLMLCNNEDIIKTKNDIGINGNNLKNVIGIDKNINVETMRNSLFGTNSF